MKDFGTHVATAAQMALGLAESLLKDIDPKLAGTRITGPNGEVDAVHPAFAIGHLAIYPEIILKNMFSQEGGPAACPESYGELFENGRDCLHDPACETYPSLGEISAKFFDGHNHLLEVLRSADDAVFDEENPIEGRMKELYPTKGGMIMFMMTSHLMFHLGQVSTWRRCFGMGPVM